VVRIGERARAELVELIGDAIPTCREVDVDQYGRTVAVCTAGDLELNAPMVARGWAWEYRQFSRGEYADEQAAEILGLGVHAGSCEPPWEYRWR
jgi:endonuclease YncB( thermonuclease family)